MKMIAISLLCATSFGCTALMVDGAPASAYVLGSDDTVSMAGSGDKRIDTAVREKLAHDAQTATEDITVTTDNGVVALDGSVSDPAVRRAAERLARGTSGVRDVSNTLSVNDTA